MSHESSEKLRKFAKQGLEVPTDPLVHNRILELGRKANEGLLTAAEDAEYAAYFEFGDILALLQLRAREILDDLGG